jgi:hypothetical protein
MVSLALSAFENPAGGLWLFLSVSAVALFSFIAVASWAGCRQAEREAFYKSETLRRITEATGEGARVAVDMLREEALLKHIKEREGIKLGGLVNLGVGLSLIIFLFVLRGPKVALCGLIPAVLGVVLLAYVYLFAPPVEGASND